MEDHDKYCSPPKAEQLRNAILCQSAELNHKKTQEICSDAARHGEVQHCDRRESMSQESAGRALLPVRDSSIEFFGYQSLLGTVAL